MKIKVRTLSGGVKEQTREVSEDSTYEDLLKSLSINPEIVIVLCNGESMPLDEKVTSGDVEILKVVTGG